tara:strand:+ start:520 stop:1332 length:813 start_codon:yes stop_codon:yes gene_type:complete
MALAAEVTQIICVADSGGSLQSKYFTISGMGTDFEQNDFYVWIEVGGSGATDPEPGGTGIKVSVATDAAHSVVASAVSTALALKDDFSTGVSTATITVTNAVRGSVTDAANVNAGFTITTETAGTGTKESNHTHPEDDMMWFIQGENLAIATTKGSDSTSVHSKLGDIKGIDESVIEGLLIHYYAEPTAVDDITDTLDLDNSLHLFVVDYVKSRLFMDRAAQSSDAAIVSSSISLSSAHERNWKDALVKFGNRKREKVGGVRVVRPFDFR